MSCNLTFFTSEKRFESKEGCRRVVHSLGGGRGGGAGGGVGKVSKPFKNLVNNLGCQSSPTATSWTRQVQIKMLEQILMNHTCNLVLWITCPGNFAHLTTCTLLFSDLTSISFLYTTSLLHSQNIAKRFANFLLSKDSRFWKRNWINWNPKETTLI